MLSQDHAKKVLLVQPNYQGVNRNKNKIDNIVGVHPPMGLLYLAAILRQDGITPKLIDANVERLAADDILDIANSFDIVGVSVLNQGYGFAITLAQHLRKDILKVCGGPHATGYVDEMLAAGFDIVVRGEGEIAFRRICQGEPLEKIPGMSWCKNGKIIHNKDAGFLDVNKIPFPARDLLSDGGTRWPYASAGTTVFPWAPILTSRGCPYRCYYCNKTIHGLPFRPRTPEDVVTEMVGLVERFGVREFDIIDDVFNLDVDRSIKICDLIIKSGINISLRFGNGMRADRIPPELAKKLRQAGTTYIAFGLESGSQRVLDSIPKQIKLDQIRQGVKLVQNEGIHTTGLFMLGLLDDTEESMQKTIDFAKELKLDIAYFSIATPYPGTQFYQRVKEKGKLLVENWEDFNHSYGRVLYEYPGAPSPKLVQTMFRKAYREFYFRPGYILRQFLKKRGLNEWKILYRGGKDLLRNIFIRGQKP